MSRKSEEQLISEAYIGIYSEAHMKPGIETVKEAFEAKGWKVKIKPGEGIAEKLGDADEPTYDIYFYMHHDTLNFYATATMPWDNNVQENEVHLSFAGENEYSVPFGTTPDGLKEAVRIVIDEVMASRLPEGPTEQDIAQHNQEEKEQEKFRISRDDNFGGYGV